MKIQPVTAKVQTAYPMLAKAAALTAIAAASLISASCTKDVQRTAGVPVPPPTQDGKKDSATPAPELEVQCTPGEEVLPTPEDAPKVQVQNPGGSVIVTEEAEKQEQGGDAVIDIEEQDDGGDVDDDDYLGWGRGD